MRHILVIADRDTQPAHALKRAVALAGAADCRISLIGFTHERLGAVDADSAQQLEDALLRQRERQLRALAAAHGARIETQAVWEKHLAPWISAQVVGLGADLAIKTGHRSESWHYTPTDWQLIRDCPVPVLIVPERPWRKRGSVLAAVDLGTRLASKRALNLKVVRSAREFADRLGSPLHLAYAVPFSQALRDLGAVEPRTLVAAARAQGKTFEAQLAAAGIGIDGLHIKAGIPEKVLASVAADVQAQTVVLGCMGRKATAGKLIGNTAERILRYVRTDVLALKP
ncbi:MAG: universal stress protein [Sinimarinibacterium sp.]|jgi:universal stress protein E